MKQKINIFRTGDVFRIGSPHLTFLMWYLINLKDEIVSLQWTTRIINWVLDRAIDGCQQLGITEMTLELEDIKKFENMLYEKIQELEIELDNSNVDREKEVLLNEIDTLKCVMAICSI
ncbi:MAG: hypothetical protein ACRD5E_06100 [Nitrososphaeraceae archaeon]